LGWVVKVRAAAAMLAVIALAVGAVAADPSPRRARAVELPSIVVIITDDQRWDTLWAMPTVRRQLIGKGVTFTNAFASNPLCCPSRASTLTGQYSHSTGVWRNQPPYGGWASFDDSSTIATWLKPFGYSTGMFGKYFNGYWRAAYGSGYIPPGWDRWVAFPRAGFYGYDLNVDGSIQPFGTAPEDYSTDVLAEEVDAFIRSTTGPLLAWYTPFAPHSPATPGPGYERAFRDLRPWRPPSYNEPDVSDKPRWVQAVRSFDRRKRQKEDAFRIDQYRTLLSVDDAIGTILQALKDTGRLANTLIVFTSDNGISYGEHRWRTKRVAYEESLRIPFVVRYDPIVAVPREDESLVLNVDVAPTAAAAAGIAAPEADGQSLLPLLASPAAPWRDRFLTEHLAKKHDRVPTFCGVRTERYLYVYYITGEEELYDLIQDPYELTNVASSTEAQPLMSELRTDLARLCNPPPPGLQLPSG
jgi:N-acetylglucosamine-6-sulfatase